MDGILSYIIDALYGLPCILVGLSFHEWGHAYAAYKRGDPTARNLGRMTVNPLAHIDPLGFLSLLILGFGWAKPVPVSTRNFKSPRKDELIVSLAGITVNLILRVVHDNMDCAHMSAVEQRNTQYNGAVLLYHKLWPCGIQSAAHSAA